MARIHGEEGCMAPVKKSRGRSALQKPPKKLDAIATGTHVLVPFGKRVFDAKVLESVHGRVTVEITINGATEPLVTSYRSDEVKVS
jgi:hypothetical protein